jgi:hypothetical protein
MTSDSFVNPNPYYQANGWSRFFHSWIAILLRKSHKQGTLHLTDLYDLFPDLESTKLTERLEANWFAELKQTKRQPSLIRATLKTMGWRPFLVGLLLIPNVNRKKSPIRKVNNYFSHYQDLAKFAQPILLTFLMGFFESCSTMPTWRAWLLALGTSLAALTSSIIYHQVTIILFNIKIMRICC